MTRPIQVLGLGADGPEGLSSRAKIALSGATFVAGGRRHLGLIGSMPIETFAIGDNIAELVDRLKRREENERCVVLASGDPLCFGVGATLLRSLPGDEILIEPDVSSLQLAFARAGISWVDAAIASVHGRPLEETLRPLLGRALIGLFTQDGESPARIAEFFLDRGLAHYSAWVGEDLGTADERIHHRSISHLPGRRFAALNFVILRREGAPFRDDLGCEVAPDHHFATPETGPVLLTHRDVRAVTLCRFFEVPEGPIWDLGAGLGGVSIDLARRFPGREVVAVERSEGQLRFLRENRLRFSAYNLEIVEGSAPEVLADRGDPAGIFLGGSGGKLDAILDVIFRRLRLHGVFVANFVGLENLSRTLDRLKSEGWTADVSQVAISRGEPLAGLTTFVPLRPVWVVRSTRPGSGDGSP